MCLFTSTLEKMRYLRSKGYKKVTILLHYFLYILLSQKDLRDGRVSVDKTNARVGIKAFRQGFETSATIRKETITK